MARFPQFPEFHCHPASFDSASTPEAFAEREVELESGAITCTDHGSMGAARKIYDLAHQNKLAPILGLEAYFRDDDCPILKARGITNAKEYLKYTHLTLHALDQPAFEVMSKRLSLARVESHGSQGKPLFNWADLEEILACNVTVGSGCLVSTVTRHLIRPGLELSERYELAKAHYDRIKGMARPGNFYVELMPHDCSREWTAGIFLHSEEDGVEKRESYWNGKKLKFQHLGEVSAEEAAAAFTTKRWKQNDLLVAIKNNRKWQDIEPRAIIRAEKIEDFLMNECSPSCPDGDIQRTVNRLMRQTAKDAGDPIVVSGDAHFAHPDEKIVQDVRLRQLGNWRFWGSYHRQTSDEAYAHFHKTMGTKEAEFASWVDNGRAWADRFRNFKFEQSVSLPTKFYPTDTLIHTMELIKTHGRMDWSNEAYCKRLDAEIQLLHRNGKLDLLPYFFLGEEVLREHEQQGMLTGPGRGSAAGLLLTYLLGITHVDPLRFGLSMERFLTLDRIKSGKLPDIDMDLGTRDFLVSPDPEKPELGWLFRRFGDHQCQIGTNTKLKIKSAVKDVMRARLGHVPFDVEWLTKRFVMPPQGLNDYDFVFGYEAEGVFVDGSIRTDPALKEFAERYPSDWAIAAKALGLARARGRHASGYVIANRPVAEFLPLQLVSKVPVTQFDMAEVEAAGGLKMDFLVVRALLDIQEAIKLTQQRSGREVPKSEIIDGKLVPGIRLIPHAGEWRDVWDLPEDQTVYHDICEGRTETVFQLNTSGAIQWLKHFNYWKDEQNGRKALDSIDALAAFTALDRPGPLDAFVTDGSGKSHNMLVEYARRARGEEAVGELPLLTKMIPETHGVITFQESLQRVYQQLMDSSGSEAEEFRTNVAKKKMDKVLKVFGPWMEKVGSKYGTEIAKNVWDQLVTFGQYGFNRSHSVCYVTISYACAFLKHHYPLEWWTAVLKNASKDEIAETFWRYCGHLIDYPDVSLSSANFEIVGERVRAPLSLLHGLGEKAHAQLLSYKPYVSIQDFCDKIEHHCLSNAKVVLDDAGQPVIQEKKIKGRGLVKVIKKKRAHNALNRRTCYALIISGAMDTLFSSDMTDMDKMMAYEAALGKATGKKPTAVLADWANLTPLRRYQMRKTVLPAYSEKLLLTVLQHEPRIIKRKRDGRVMAMWRQEHGEIEVRPPAAMFALNNADPLPDGQVLWLAMPAYVMTQRHFSYTNKKTLVPSEACEFGLDVDGVHMSCVIWPNKQGELDPLFKERMQGAVVMAAFCKRSSDRPFGLQNLTVLQPPLKADKKAVEKGAVDDGATSNFHDDGTEQSDRSDSSTEGEVETEEIRAA